MVEVARGQYPFGLIEVDTNFATPLNQIVVADFNGDGFRDVAAMDFSTNNGTFYVFLGNGRGGFSTPLVQTSVLRPELRPLQMVKGDFNGDDITDLAFLYLDTTIPSDTCPTCRPQHLVVLRTGRRDGTFEPARITAVPHPETMVAGDFNRDGRDDLLIILVQEVLFTADGPHVLSGEMGKVLLGNSDATFGGFLTIGSPSTNRIGSFGSHVAAGDFNHDGRLDFAVTLADPSRGFGAGGTAMFPGRGDGTFEDPTFTRNRPFCTDTLLVSDLNDDGWKDLLLANSCNEDHISGGSLVAYYGQPGGSFGPQVVYYQGPAYGFAAAIDLRSIGFNDLIARARTTVTSWNVYLNNADGTFAPPEHLLRSNTDNIVVADFNNDGRADIVAVGHGNPSIYTLLNRPVDIAIAKHSNKTLLAGRSNIYTIEVSNVGPSPTEADGVTVTDNLPAGTSYVSADGPDWRCSLSGRTVTCRSGLLRPGEIRTLSLTVNVDLNAPGKITNTATVSTPGEPNLTNNTASVTTAVILNDVAAGIKHTGAFIVGQKDQYVLQVVNNGNVATNGTGTVFVTDQLPNGIQFVTGPGCSAVVQVVTCPVNTVLAAGKGLVIPLTVFVDFPAVPSVNNTATVHYSLDANPANDSATDNSAVKIDPLPALELLKTYVDALPIDSRQIKLLDDTLSQTESAIQSHDRKTASSLLASFKAAAMALNLSPKLPHDIVAAADLILNAI